MMRKKAGTGRRCLLFQDVQPKGRRLKNSLGIFTKQWKAAYLLMFQMSWSPQTIEFLRSLYELKSSSTEGDSQC
jgi:hypothetical protein